MLACSLACLLGCLFWCVSTAAGLDPVSRRNLWSVILRTMSHRAVILTTHSMDEAEALCKRIGIMGERLSSALLGTTLLCFYATGMSYIIIIIFLRILRVVLLCLALTLHGVVLHACVPMERWTGCGPTYLPACLPACLRSERPAARPRNQAAPQEQGGCIRIIHRALSPN